MIEAYDDLELKPGEELVTLHLVVHSGGPRGRFTARLLPKGSPVVARTKEDAIRLALGCK